MTRFALSFLLLLGSTGLAAACDGETQIELNDCAAADYKRADEALNAAWGPTKAHMDTLGAGYRLVDAQRKWLSFRDAACTAEIAPYAGGTLQLMIWYSCLARLTDRRTEDLLTMR